MPAVARKCPPKVAGFSRQAVLAEAVFASFKELEPPVAMKAAAGGNGGEESDFHVFTFTNEASAEKGETMKTKAKKKR